jgi:hypothetical protein
VLGLSILLIFLTGLLEERVTLTRSVVFIGMRAGCHFESRSDKKQKAKGWIVRFYIKMRLVVGGQKIANAKLPPARDGANGMEICPFVYSEKLETSSHVILYYRVVTPCSRAASSLLLTTIRVC